MSFKLLLEGLEVRWYTQLVHEVDSKREDQRMTKLLSELGTESGFDVAAEQSPFCLD